MFLVHAKDDGLGKPVSILHEFSQMAGNGLSTGSQSNDTLEILGLVLAVRNFIAITIISPLRGPPACSINIGNNPMYPVWCKESVFNPLSQAVGVNGIAKIRVGIPVVVPQRRGCHTKLVGRLEIFQDLPPVALVSGAPPVTLVHYDQVEEVRAYSLNKPGRALILGQGLVDGKVHLPAFDCLSIFDLPAGITEWGECLVLGIIDQDVSVGQVENAWPAVLPCAFHPDSQSFQQIWNATRVLPVPVAMVKRMRFFPCKIASIDRLIAIS